MTSAKKVFDRESIFKSRRGASTLGCLFFLVVIGAAGYVGLKVGTVYWDYFDVRQKIRETLNWAVAGQAKSDGEIFQKVVANVRQADLELKPRDVKITHSGENLTISASWTREIEFPGYTLPLNFSVSLTEIKRWTRGGLIIK
jgi:hypothetical protein